MDEVLTLAIIVGVALVFIITELMVINQANKDFEGRIVELERRAEAQDLGPIQTRYHDDPDHTGQCIYCGTILDPLDEDFDKNKADTTCPRRVL